MKRTTIEDLKVTAQFIARETGTDPSAWTVERGSRVNGRRWRIVGPAVITGATAAELMNSGWEWLDGYRFAVRSAARVKV